MAENNATTMKNNGVIIYAVGIHTINPSFMSAISSGPNFTFYTPDTSQLTSIFNAIAQDISLRLVKSKNL